MKGWKDCPDCWGSGHVKGWGAECVRAEEPYKLTDAPCNIDPCLPGTYNEPCAYDFTSLLAEHSKGCSNTQALRLNPADCEECMQELVQVIAKRMVRKIALDYLAELTRRVAGLP